MNEQTPAAQETHAPAESAVRALYWQMLEGWNGRDAEGLAALYAVDGSLVGFDGSPLNGRAEIAALHSQIFADHVTAAFVGKVREVRFLTQDVALLRAIAGMVPPGQTDLNPAVNAAQTLIATRRDGAWCIAHFQSTPAQFHGRPELAQAFTEELRHLL